MIKAEAVIEKFRYALDIQGGYIWGKYGQSWTRKDQDGLIARMVKLFGNAWQTDKAAKDDDYYMGAKYGAKWIGHRVWDCSGLWRWAMSELGGSVAHGSNSIYDRYCSAKGKMKAGKRTDGKEMLPGTAVFTGTDGDHGHIGLYIGGGEVIEAAGTQQGVIKSKVTNSKWTYWGELKDVSYEGKPEPKPEPGYAIVTGKRVALRKEPSKSAAIIMRIDTGETVKMEPEPEKEWDYVSYNGKVGWMMREFLQEG